MSEGFISWLRHAHNDLQGIERQLHLHFPEGSVTSGGADGTYHQDDQIVKHKCIAPMPFAASDYLKKGTERWERDVDGPQSRGE